MADDKDQDERNRRLTEALAPLGRGELPDGTPIDLAAISERANRKAWIFARRLRDSAVRDNRRYKGQH